jgi:iron complex outermembrane receptor protein
VEITTDKTIISVDEFKKPGEVRSLTDVLTEIGGIDIQRINPLLASPGDEVSIRGLNEGRMVIEIDGRRINHTGHMGRYIVDWSTLNMDDVERIEIIRGGHSVLHPFAIGGVVNIITKKGKKTDDYKPEVNISSGYGAFNTYNYGVSANGGFLKRVGYHVSASRQETDGYLRNNFQQNDSLNSHVSLFLPYGAKLSVSGKFSFVDYGYPVVNDPSRPDYDDDYPDFYGTADQLRHIPPTTQPSGPRTAHWMRNTNYLDGIADIPLGPGTIHYHIFRTDGRRKDNYYRNGVLNTSYVEDRTWGMIGEYRDIKLWFNKLTVGAEYQELGQPHGNARIYIVESAYAQNVMSFFDGRLKITPGVRYYHIDKDTYLSWFDQGLAAPAWPISGKKEKDEDWFPSFKVDVQALENTAVYAAVSRSLRLPCP